MSIATKKTVSILPEKFFITEDRDLVEVDKELFPLMVEAVKAVLSENSAFNDLRSSERGNHVLLYQRIQANPVVHLRHGYSFDVGGDRKVWRHLSTAVRTSLSQILQRDPRTAVFFSWPVWSMALPKGDNVFGLPKQKVQAKTETQAPKAG